MSPDSRHTTIDRNVLDRFLADECLPAERETVQTWLASNPGQAARIQAPNITQLSTLDADWTIVRKRIDVPRSSSSRISWIPRLPFIGAALAALIAVTIVSLRDWNHPPSPSGEMMTYSTGNAQRATIMFSDGTRVTLNVASRIQVPANYTAGNRTLHLTGEAFFDVSHRSGAPFTVVAGPGTTRVLGTSFSVRHYENEPTTTVAVRDGKVAVGSTVLTAQQQVQVGWKTVGQVSPADPALFSFESGVLTLNAALLRDAIPALNRWYDTEIQLTDPRLATLRITGEFEAGSVADLMAVLQATFNGIDVARNGRLLILSRRS